MRKISLIVTMVLLTILPGAAIAGCAADTAPCKLEAGNFSGTYHLVLPSGQPPAKGWPAVVFLHGWGGDGKGVLNMRDMVQIFQRRGYALIAPDGTDRENRDGRGWLFHPQHRNGRDEGAFLGAATDDAAGRFAIDPSWVILAGFSIGGSMTSYVACETPARFSAYAPVAGSFWQPLPETCAAPARLFHTHGWSDAVVPLEGRSVGNGAITQGDVFAAMNIWRSANRCPQSNPTGFSRTGDFQIRAWTECAPESSLVFALHPGGHGVPPGWATMMLDWYEGGSEK